MPTVWTWNIDRDNQQFFADELKAGRLRQGWAYSDQLDLRLIDRKNQQGLQLDEDESAAWERANAMLSMREGDVVLVKNTPTPGCYSLVEVLGRYDFDRKTPTGDFGHILPVKTLKEVNKHSAYVSGGLRSAIDNQRHPISPAVKRANEILNLLEQPSALLKEEARWPSRFRDQSTGIVEIIRRNVASLHPSEFEELIRDVLDIQNFENTRITAGAGENGADIVMSVSAPFFDDLNVVVQIKHHPGEDNDTTSINQLKRAFDYYKAVAGLLVTSADKIGRQLNDAIEALKTDGKTVAVLHGEKLHRLILHVLASDTGDAA